MPKMAEKLRPSLPSPKDLNISQCTYQCKPPPEGGSAGKGGDLTKKLNFWSTFQGWGSIFSSNAGKNPHLGARYQIKDKLYTHL